MVKDPEEPCHQIAGPPHSENPDNTPKNVIAEQLQDGSYAITIPTMPPNQSSLCQPQHLPVSYNNTVENTSNADMKYLQNLLPNCRFDSCTITISTGADKAM